jgi:hypothetical protein
MSVLHLGNAWADQYSRATMEHTYFLGTPIEKVRKNKMCLPALLSWLSCKHYR